MPNPTAAAQKHIGPPKWNEERRIKGIPILFIRTVYGWEGGTHIAHLGRHRRIFKEGGLSTIIVFTLDVTFQHKFAGLPIRLYAPPTVLLTRHPQDTVKGMDEVIRCHGFLLSQ